MNNQTHVYLITGFLGSGKTTLLNRITQIVPKNLKILILMNEFGEIGVDGTLIQNKSLDMIEISRGSIFCACVKSDFIKALVEIHQDIQPDLLIIESTGAANPKDLIRNLSLSLFNGRFVVKDRICLLDAANFTAVYDTFQSVEDQIASSNVFILNKTDLAEPGELREIKEIVQKHHPSPVIYETVHARMPLDWLAKDLGGPEPDRAEPGARLSHEEIESALNMAMNDPEAQAAPSDALSSFLMEWQGGSPEDLGRLLHGLPAGLARAKGYLDIQDGTRLLNWSINHFILEEARLEPDHSYMDNKIVFILRQDAETEVMERINASGLFKCISIQRPMGIQLQM